MVNQARQLTKTLRLGRWEWVALPDFGISCMKAQLSSSASYSTLESEHCVMIDLDGRPGVSFRLYPLVDEPKTFVLSAAPLCGDVTERKIRTSLILGGCRSIVELVLIPRRRGLPSPLTLGPNTFDGNFSIDFEAEGLAGFPFDAPHTHPLSAGDSLEPSPFNLESIR